MLLCVTEFAFSKVNAFTAQIASISCASINKMASVFVVVWNAMDECGVTQLSGQLLDSNATKIGAEFKIAQPSNQNCIQPSVVGLINGGFVVSWTNQGGSVFV